VRCQDIADKERSERDNDFAGQFAQSRETS
jgi:hypothetical protein